MWRTGAGTLTYRIVCVRGLFFFSASRATKLIHSLKVLFNGFWFHIEVRYLIEKTCKHACVMANFRVINFIEYISLMCLYCILFTVCDSRAVVH